MPWIISPFGNGAIIEVTANSPLLKNNPVVSAPTTPVNNYTNSQGQSSYVPQVSVPAPVTSVSSASATQTVDSAKAKRIEEGKYATYSTIPEVAELQRQSRKIYEETGRWDSAAQISLHNKAESIRLGSNPNYPAGGIGTNDAQYFLPGAGESTGLSDLLGSIFGAGKEAAGTATAPANNGTMIMGIGAVALLLMLKR